VTGKRGFFFDSLLRASSQVELFDEELESEPWRRGIRTAAHPPSRLGPHLEELMAAGTFACLLGYSSFPRELSESGRYATVLFAPSRDSLREGGAVSSPQSCALAVGVRAGGREREGKGGARVLSAREIAAGRGLGELLPAPDRPRLLVIDPLVMDPSLLPVPANIEPGGLGWYPLLRLLRELFESGKVQAALMRPCRLTPSDPGPPFVLARLAAKLVAYALAGK
jgi:agmatinase